MTDRAHVKDGVVLALYAGEKGRIRLPGNKTISPIVIGTDLGEDGKIVPYSKVVNDESTGPAKMQDGPVRKVTDKGVTDTYTLRDKTAEELSREDDDEFTNLDKPIFKAMAQAIFMIGGGTAPPEVFETRATFRKWLKGMLR